MAKYNISEKANDSNYVSPYETGKGKYQSSGSTQTAYQKRQAELDSKAGITTSDDAASILKTAKETLQGIQGNLNESVASGEVESSKTSKVENPLTALYARLGTLKKDLAAAKEKEKLAQETLANDQAQASLDAVGSSTEGGGSAGESAISQFANQHPDDLMVQSIADAGAANLDITMNLMNAIGQYREQGNEYTQQDIDSISRTAERSVERQLAENDRVTRAMQFAGVVGGRAQFAPVVEQSIINDVVQEGLDKIEVINEKKNTAIREARKAEADFNIDMFEQQANLAKDYNDQIEATFSQMNAQVRQAEKDERDRIDFRQQQEERNSIILAGELINSTPEQIAKAAVANGIDHALLTKAVNDAKFEQQGRDFDTASNKLSLKQQRANLAKTYNDMKGGSEEDGGFDATDSALLRQAGLEGATNDEKIAFLNLTASKQNEKITAHQKEASELEDQSVNEVIADVVGDNTMFSIGGNDDKIKAVASAFGINPAGWKNKTEANNFLKTIVGNLKTSYPGITDSEIKEYLKEIPEDATTEEMTAYLQFARKGI